MVYVVVTIGLAIILVPIVLLNPMLGDHVYILAPLAVSIPEEP